MSQTLTAAPFVSHVTGDAIAASIGHRYPAPDSAENCYKLATHDSWGSASQTNYTYLFLWDARREVVFPVLHDLYTSSFACTGTIAHPFVDCPVADKAIWAAVAAQVLEAAATRSRQDQEIRDYIISLRAHKGQGVIVVKGRKMPKGAMGTIERVFDGQYGLCALIAGQWIALDNLIPDVPKPADGSHLAYYYENRKNYFLSR